MAREGIPFVVAAPSGAGKTTVCRAIVERDDGIVLSVSHTTRPRRVAERDAVDYHFVDRAEFQRMVRAGAFLEHAEYSGNLYGTSWQAIQDPLARGLDVLLEIEVQGARQVRDRLDRARLVFLLPPSLAELERRLRARGSDGDQEIERRLALARRELRALDLFHYAIVNDLLERTIADLATLIEAERTGHRQEALARFAPALVSPELRAGLGP